MLAVCLIVSPCSLSRARNLAFHNAVNNVYTVKRREPKDRLPYYCFTFASRDAARVVSEVESIPFSAIYTETIPAGSMPNFAD